MKKRNNVNIMSDIPRFARKGSKKRGSFIKQISTSRSQRSISKN